MTPAGEFFMRWRVRIGYPLALAVFWLARPVPWAIACGAGIGGLGLLLRGYAAGYLRKQESLVTSGPYAYTRNPLYLGSAVLAAGFAFATHSWLAAFLIAAYFALFYPPVMRREQAELRLCFGIAFDEFARRVPLFLPRLTPARLAPGDTGAFSWALYGKNREYEAALGFLLTLVLLVAICWLRAR